MDNHRAGGSPHGRSQRPSGRSYCDRGQPSGQSTVNRYYDPTTNQFLSVDPLVNKTHTPYAYTGDNPLSATDPTGLDLFGQGGADDPNSYDMWACGIPGVDCSGITDTTTSAYINSATDVTFETSQTVSQPVGIETTPYQESAPIAVPGGTLTITGMVTVTGPSQANFNVTTEGELHITSPNGALKTNIDQIGQVTNQICVDGNCLWALGASMEKCKTTNGFRICESVSATYEPDPPRAVSPADIAVGAVVGGLVWAGRQIVQTCMQDPQVCPPVP